MLDKLSPVRSGWIQWRSLLGLAALQAAITLTWVVYNAYLVQLLDRVGFPAMWANYLLVMESGIAVLLEPVMGWLSDRTPPSPDPATQSAAQWVASRFPLIAIGTILAAACFVMTPLIALGLPPQSVMAWILPAVIIVWALCMSIFQSPALALMGQYASQIKRPQATSILLIAGALVRVFGASSTQLILSWGPLVAFASGSISLLAAALLLQRWQPKMSVNRADQSPELVPPPPPTSALNLGLIFAVGGGVGLTGRCIGLVLGGQLIRPGISLLFVWLLTQAVVLVPVGWLANHLETRRTLLGSLGLVAMVLGTMLRHSDNLAALVGLTVLLGLASSFVGVTTFPFALDRLPRHQAGLGMGLYFSGAALAGMVFGVALQSGGKLNLEPAALLGIVGVVVAIAGAVASLRR